MAVTLLIDADIIAYQAAASCESEYDWGDTGGEVKVADLDQAKETAESQITYLMKKLDADEVVICLSDEVQNFRDEVWSGYKQNRSGTERPEHLYTIKDWFSDDYEVVIKARMEADDVMGIMATEPHEGKRIIVSEDKDMQTIPAFVFNPNKDKKQARKITPAFAERFLLWQTLTGDTTDGYKGAPGCGPKTADAILDDSMIWTKTEREITRGKNKGKIEVKWALEKSDAPVWDRILSAYIKAGQGEKEAIREANLARILKHWNVEGNRIIPWKPADIEHTA